jgi:hypothetical protein
VSFNYPQNPTKKNREEYRRFFESLQDILPCGACRVNLKENYKASGFHNRNVFESRSTLSIWVHKLHTNINTRLGKPKGLTYTETRNIYEHLRAQCAPKSSGDITRCEKPVKHEGCTNPKTGVSKQCEIHIVPLVFSQKTFQIDPECLCESEGNLTVRNISRFVEQVLF